MNLLSAENISKSYSEKELLNNINLGINEGDKIGVIGINGTGKSTLLKMIAGAEKPDEGRVIKVNNIQIEYLSQNPYFDPEATVLVQIFKGNSPIMALIRDYQKALQDPNTSSERIIKLSNDMDVMDAWSLESEAKSILTKLGVLDFNAKVGTLSGGQRKRIALAAALINPSDLLILDEPTNHLDNDTIDWLEQLLNTRKGSLLMITHDRYFLDRVVNKIVEVDRGGLYSYEGNYSSFLGKKIERQEMESVHDKKRQSLLKKELAWMRKGAKARTTKQKARIGRYEDLKEHGTDIAEDKIEISVGSSRLGKKVIELAHVNKSYDKDKLIEDFSYIVLRDDRVGIVGPNGAGKSTLLNIIAGELAPDSGSREVGETVKIGMFSQETQHMNDELRVIEYIKEVAEYLTTSDGSKITASQMLERFLFPSAAQWTPIGKLSGGEKRRLYLLKVLMDAPNVLFLDEPTNDLDIETLTILEDYLDEFPGAVLTVSHDRYFLDRIAERIFAFEANGQVVEYTGNFSDYKEKTSIRKGFSGDVKGSHNVEKAPSTKEEQTTDEFSHHKKKEKPLKFSFKEQKEYEEIDDVIARIEGQIEETEKQIGETAADYTLLQQLVVEKQGLETQLQEKMERWVFLNDLADKIEAEKKNK
ncbi:ABC transporter related [Alkaliphilus metalliredigens QYMF]|uniref:ABC transporter related n=1 Tax=Alkaliphilus metalliredigens (strain QYMF) TaxID=293826 RepID=A6TTI2_ALKMQ|nr:ABC-F family ATP-binding cassette domain-containing protein [Alkaliphilus metalliredigens]ABR49500.1 ABC transporter related [Alkaliphilus metalliredigens QYMF]